MEDHDEDPEAKRFAEAFKALLGAYMVITDMLAELPLPIQIPPMDEDWDPMTAMPAMDRVRTVIRDEPLSSETTGMINTLILDWLTAYDLAGTFQGLGPAPWRLDALQAAMARVAIGTHFVNRLLGRDERE